MKKNKGSETQGDSKKHKVKEDSDDDVQSLRKTINGLFVELEMVKENVRKRKSENTSLKVLFYTGLAILLLGFLYSNSNLQRAHMRSLEKNIIALEQRMLKDMNHIKMNFELDLQGLHKQLAPMGTDIFTILNQMDNAITQIRPKKEQTTRLINQVRLNANEFSRILRESTNQPKNP